ncbi:hypothetical protein CR513_38759, partial [Mucuna pruriens]
MPRRDVEGAGNTGCIVPTMVHIVPVVGTSLNYGLTQTFEGVPHGVLHDETVGDIEGLYQDEDVSVLP